MSAGPITELVLQTEAILRLAVARDGKPIKASDVVAAVGLDPGSARRDLRRMAEAGLLSVDGPGDRGAVHYIQTALAVDAVEALDRAAKAGPATGFPVARIDAFRPNPDQPRKRFPDEMIADRAESIVQVGGFLHPLVVEPADASGVRMIQDGECRWRAAQLLVAEDRLPEALKAGLPYVERAGGEAEMLKVALIANAQRSDLTPWEDAQGLKRLKDLLGLSARGVALAIGRAKEGSERGIKDVQEKIKTATEATPANIALHESGLWSWEQLRESVRVETPAAKTPAEPEEPEQVELVEAVAAATPTEEIDPDVIVAVLEIAHRANLYPGPTSALGPSTKITDFINPSSSGGKYPLATALAAGGYALFVHNYPQHVVLLRPGADLVKRFADTPDQLDAAIRTALREAGVEEGDIDDLEREAKYQTEWLNVTPPTPPPELTDDEALILLELYDAKKRGGEGYMYGTPAYYGAQVQPWADRQVLDGLKARKLVELHLDEPQRDGSFRVDPRTYYSDGAEAALKGRWPEIGKAGERTKALFALRTTLLGAAEAEAAKKEKRYSTPWLNGPFEVSEEVQAKLDEAKRRQQQAERDREAQANRERATAERLEQAVSALEADAREMDPGQLRKRLQQLLTDVKNPAPWSQGKNRWHGFATDGRGQSVANDGWAARLAIVALNALIGEWPEAEEEQVTVIVFERWVAEALQQDHGLAVESVASDQANKALKRFLEDNGVAFGDDGFEWDRDDANAIASDWAEDFIQDGVIVDPDHQASAQEGEEDHAAA